MLPLQPFFSLQSIIHIYCIRNPPVSQAKSRVSHLFFYRFKSCSVTSQLVAFRRQCYRIIWTIVSIGTPASFTCGRPLVDFLFVIDLGPSPPFSPSRDEAFGTVHGKNGDGSPPLSGCQPRSVPILFFLCKQTLPGSFL